MENFLTVIKDFITIGMPFFLAGGFVYMTRELGRRVETIEKNIETLNKVVIDQALSTQRQDNYERRTDMTFAELKGELRDLRTGLELLKS